MSTSSHPHRRPNVGAGTEGAVLPTREIPLPWGRARRAGLDLRTRPSTAARGLTGQRSCCVPATTCAASISPSTNSTSSCSSGPTPWRARSPCTRPCVWHGGCAQRSGPTDPTSRLCLYGLYAGLDGAQGAEPVADVTIAGEYEPRPGVLGGRPRCCGEGRRQATAVPRRSSGGAASACPPAISCPRWTATPTWPSAMSAAWPATWKRATGAPTVAAIALCPWSTTDAPGW